MIAYKQANSKKEIRQILTLQQQNLPKNLSETEKKEQGFLTVEHSFDLLWKMNCDFPHTLAMEDEKVIGYALSMTPNFAQDIDVLKSMFDEINKYIKAKDFIVMGQICIAKTHRGQGVFKGLYQKMLVFTQERFNTIITEVDTKNERSMNAHKAVGFKELSRHSSDGRDWSLIMLKNKKAT